MPPRLYSIVVIAFIFGFFGSPCKRHETPAKLDAQAEKKRTYLKSMTPTEKRKKKGGGIGGGGTRCEMPDIETEHFFSTGCGGATAPLPPHSRRQGRRARTLPREPRGRAGDGEGRRRPQARAPEAKGGKRGIRSGANMPRRGRRKGRTQRAARR